MGLKLYYASGACSFVPHTLLELAGVDYEAQPIKLHKGEHQSPEFLAINPRGQVPVLVDGEEVITQIVAIVSHLDERLPGACILPRPGTARTRVLQVLAWMNNTVHPTFTHIFMPFKFTDDAAAQAAVKAWNVGLYRSLLGEIETMVQQAGPWLTGENPGVLDAYALTLLRWGSLAGINPEDFSATWALAQRFAALPAVARIIERERLQLSLYKPA